jgi:hypothetical protein
MNYFVMTPPDPSRDLARSGLKRQSQWLISNRDPKRSRSSFTGSLGGPLLRGD